MAHKRKIMTFLLLSAGCGTTSSPSKQTGAAEVPVPAVRAAANPAPVAAVAPTAPATPPTPAPDEAQPKARLDLRIELYQSNDRDAVLGASARFRALCDADGYPLVGNIATKGERYSVADYCTDVRTAARTGV